MMITTTNLHPNNIHSTNDNNQTVPTSNVLLLPSLLDLCSLLCISADSFMSIKLKQELLPELMQLLRHFQLQYLTKENTTQLNVASHSQQLQPNKLMSRASLVVLQPSTQPTTAIDLHESLSLTTDNLSIRSHVDETKTSGKNFNNKDAMFSQSSRVKLAVVHLLRQLCDVAPLQQVVQSHASALVYLLVNLLSNCEVSE